MAKNETKKQQREVVEGLMIRYSTNIVLISLLYALVGLVFGIIEPYLFFILLFVIFVSQVGIVITIASTTLTEQEKKELSFLRKTALFTGENILFPFIYGIWIDLVLIKGFYGLYKVIFVNFSVKLFLLSLFFLFIGRRLSINLNNFIAFVKNKSGYWK